MFSLVLAGVHTMNVLESNMVYSSVFVSWSCLRAVTEREKRRGASARGSAVVAGGRGGCI